MQSLAQDVSERYLLFDCFSSLNHRKFNKDVDLVVHRFQESGVQRAILRSTGISVSRDSLRLCRLFPDALLCSVGVSPHESRQWESETRNELLELLKESEVVAIGETGLDFERHFSSPTQQLEAFESSLQLSVETQKPVVCIVRGAHSQTLSLLSSYVSRVPFVVIHSFFGSQEECLQYVSLSDNVFIGVSGLVSKEKNEIKENLQKKTLPLNRLLLESDSPFHLPNARSLALTSRSSAFLQRYCNFSRNEPCCLPAIAEIVAQMVGQSGHEVALQTTFNALKVFGISINK